MPRSLERPRLVLASLVPVDTRADPLDHAALPRTDFGVSSALRVTKAQRHVVPARAEDASSRSNQHDDERRRLDEQLEATKRAWTQQQERSFDAQIERLDSSRGSASFGYLPPPSLSSPLPSALLDARLRGIEDLIRGAGDALSVETNTSTPLGSARKLYAKAADQLAKMLRDVQARER